jgi:hypothetical protein
VPRYLLRRAYRAVDLDERPLQPLDDLAVRAMGAARIFAAAQAVVSASPGARGNGAVDRACRRVAVHVCRDVGIGSSDCQFALGIGRSAFSRLSRAPRDRGVAKAVRIRLALEERVR